jgi:hypothetical protein
MPLTIFSIRGLPGSRRERLEAAVVAGGKHARAPHEGWIAVDLRGTVRALIIGPDGFEPSFAVRHRVSENTKLGW